MEIQTLDKQQIYILGVSGGPDSMALFDMCVKEGLHIIVAHMNYQLRESAQRDMEIVQNYCKKYQVPCVVRMQNKECKGNFQAFARHERYALYRELYVENHAAGVLLAHHFDDHLETYLMQKRHQRYANVFGISERSEIMSCTIIRPLLHLSKQDLEMYCNVNHVPYGIDESNLSDHYERNRIRHTVIEHMSQDEKQKLAEEIRLTNKEWKKKSEEAYCFLRIWDRRLASLQALCDDDLQQVLVQYIYEECQQRLQRHEIKIIAKMVKENAKQWTRDIGTTYVIYSEYEKLCIDETYYKGYAYHYDVLSYGCTPYFAIEHNGTGVQALTLCESDFPITIRNYQEGDEIRLRLGTKKINRWFIDRKIPKKQRTRWPIVVNAYGNVIMVPELGCDIAHFSNNPTCFVVK